MAAMKLPFDNAVNTLMAKADERLTSTNIKEIQYDEKYLQHSNIIEAMLV